MVVVGKDDRAEDYNRPRAPLTMYLGTAQGRLPFPRLW